MKGQATLHLAFRYRQQTTEPARAGFLMPIVRLRSAPPL